MNFKNISIIFTFLTLYLNVQSSPVGHRHCKEHHSKSGKGTKVSCHKSDASNDINIEVETEAVTETETETTSEIFDDEIIINEECLTPECYEISKFLLSNMDLTADPCEDFYQFSCGGWINENEIPENQPEISITSQIENKNKDIIRQIIEGEYQVNEALSPEDQELDKEIFNKIKTIYDTCMDEDTINKLGKEPMINFLNQFDFYNNKTKYESVDEITDLIADLHNYGISYIFGYGVALDIFNDHINVMTITQQQLLYSNQYKNDAFISSYKSVIMETLNLLFDDDQKNKRNIEEMADKIVEFEKKIFDISIPEEQSQNDISIVYNPTTVGELMKAYPNINWKLYISKRLNENDVKTPVNDETYIINQYPTYFEALNKLLGEIDTNTLIYYAEWCTIFTFFNYLSDDFSTIFYRFYFKTVLGVDVEETQERYISCTSITENIMGNALGKYFIEKTFNGNSKNEIKELINEIRQAMINRIPKISWLDQATADYAIEKVKKMYTENIGYPDYILKPKELLKEYEGFEIDSDILFNTMVNFIKFETGKNIKSIDEPVDLHKWPMTPQTVNACYSSTENSINFPAGILQSPVYNVNQPDYLNYGGIGSIIGHELTHAFDNSTGSLYDADGVFRKWWTNSTFNQYTDLTTCFVEQYNQYEIMVNSDGKDINVDGTLTLDENIADNGGIKRAFEAWKLSSKDTKKFNERNKALPGLSDFTAEQLFYVSFGQFYCEKVTPVKLENSKDVHAIGKYRVIGVLSNNEDFAKAFNCPKKSPMNPEKKCIIW